MTAFIIILLLLIGWDVGWYLAGVKPLFPWQLKKLLKGKSYLLTLIDVHTPWEYNWFHLKGAVNAPELLFDIDALRVKSKEVPLIVICMTGHRSPMVAYQLKKRGYKLGRERKDSYVNELYKFMNKGGNRQQSMVDRLLFSAMIEARSCERFKLLSEKIKDEELSKFYHDLMISEAGHYTTFITFARQYGKGINVDKRWQELIDFEAEVIQNYGKSETIHG